MHQKCRCNVYFTISSAKRLVLTQRFRLRTHFINASRTSPHTTHNIYRSSGAATRQTHRPPKRDPTHIAAATLLQVSDVQYLAARIHQVRCTRRPSPQPPPRECECSGGGPPMKDRGEHFTPILADKAVHCGVVRPALTLRSMSVLSFFLYSRMSPFHTSTLLCSHSHTSSATWPIRRKS